jgi:hypothetical protein
VGQIAKLARLGELKSIRSVMRESGEEKMKAAINSILADLVLFFNVGKSMSEIQVRQTTDLIIVEKPYLSLPDLQVCFRRAKSGVYGKLFDRIDGGVIFDFIIQYEKEKTDEAENQSIYEHSRFKKKTDTEAKSAIHPDSQKIIDEIKNRLAKQIEQEREKEAIIRSSRRELSQVSDPTPEQKWLATYDLIFKKRGIWVGGSKFIDRNGVKMTMTDYLKFRSKKYTVLLNHLIDNYLC